VWVWSTAASLAVGRSCRAPVQRGHTDGVGSHASSPARYARTWVLVGAPAVGRFLDPGAARNGGRLVRAARSISLVGANLSAWALSAPAKTDQGACTDPAAVDRLA